MSPKERQKKVSNTDVHYFKINPPTFCCPLFWNLSQPLGQDQQNSKQTYCQLPIIIFLWTPKSFISPESFLNFLLNLYIPPWLPRSFKFILLRLLQIHLLFKKLKSVQFYSCPQAKLSPRFLSLSPRQTGIAHSSRTAFSEDIFSWAERGGEDYVVEKITKINKGIGHKFW